ncbi:MAG: rod shape-determining protein RodA [Candidatus Omnitrophica bacterium]|nr:rod shape-determining protein RodA [Candidatus Omnitrophota bacterium]
MHFKNFDRTLFFATLAILFIGLLTLYSASREYRSQDIIFRQVFWMIFGIAVLFVILRVDYQRIVSLSYVLYGITLLFLVMVLFSGRARGGAHRWISLGFFNLQPSELAKITLILALSSYASVRRSDVTKISFFCKAFLLAIPAFLLILIEPDLGTALLLVPVTLAMLYIAGVNIMHILGAILLGLASFPVFWHFLKGYQRQRLFVFINPNIDPLGSGYTIIQSKIAVGSGGLFGKGWLAGTQNQLNFLPERHTDFIFSVVGEEWGFIGALLLILLYALIVYRGIKIIETTPDTCGKLIATGLVTLFTLQVLINIGMTIGFLPVVGLTLPLISYGGSSLITTLLCIGLLLNIGMRRPLF